MASQLKDIARSAPDAARGLRPITTWREDMITMALTVWGITAMFFDGRGHNNETGQESFFSTAHLFLYTGMTVLGLWIGLLVMRYQGVQFRKSLVPDLKLIPVGYGVAIIGLITLGIGGPADLIWHEAYGFEVGVEAIYSAPHLMLFFGGLLVSSTGIRSMWAKQDLQLDFRQSLPVLLSTVLFIGVAGFITMYLSAFMTNVAMTSDFMNDLESLQGRLRQPVDEPQRRPDRLRRRQLAVLLLQRRPRGGDDRHHHAGADRPGPAAAAPLAAADGRRDLDLPRLRPAGEHHDLVPRRGPDPPAGPRRPGRSTSRSSASAPSARTGA